MSQLMNIEEVSTSNIEQFVGSIYYVDAGMTNDNGNGTTPSTAKLLFASAITAASAAGNDWDEGATVLTFDDATDFVAADLIWITSSAYKPDGEVVRIVSIDGAAVTIERETSQFVGTNTGLRWAHTTNIGAGSLYAYLCWRDEEQYHTSEFDFSAGSAKDFSIFNFPQPRGLNPNCGLIARIQNSTDGTNGAGLSMTINYKD